MRNIAARLLLIILTSLCIVFLVDGAYRHTYQLSYHWPQNVLVSPPIADKYTLVLLGNSHSGSGITFERYQLKSLDLSGAAQKFETDLALLKQYQNQIADGAVVIINASPISFSHTNANSSKGFQSGYYGRVSPVFIPNLDWGDYIESEFFPFVRSGYYWREKHALTVKDQVAHDEAVAFEQLRAKPTAAEPTPVEKTSAPVPVSGPKFAMPVDEIRFNVEHIKQGLANPVKIPKKHEESVNFMFNKWYYTDEFSPEYFAANRRDLEKMIAFCLKHNWRPVIITIPITQELQQGLLPDYLSTYLYQNLDNSNIQNVEYIDFSPDTRITTNNAWFGNADHLNDEGAAAFSYVLLQTLIEKGYLSPAVDDYDYGPLYITPTE